LPHALSSGIGLSNVHERLRVLYGAPGRLILTGAPGKGACVRVEIPLDLAEQQPASPEHSREGGRISA
jgi:sensor histidine kinase YesM